MHSSLPVTYRPHRPGDMGHIIARHGAIYSEEYGFDQRFEALVARIAADFLDNFDRARDRCWIAEQGGTFMGCIVLVHDGEQGNAAKLRLLLVDENARGKGVGTRLVQQCIEFAREAGYETVWLWTQSELTGARKIYKNAGFVLVDTEKHASWGVEILGEKWELKL